MKKFIKYFSILFVLVLIITACNSVDNNVDEEFDKIVLNTSEVNNYDANLNMFIYIEALGQKQEADANFKIKSYNDDIIEYKMQYENQSINGYVEKKDDLYYLYTEHDGKWIYSASKEKGVPNIASNLKNIFNENIKIEKQKENEYTITLNKNKLKELELINDADELINQLPDNIEALVNTKDNYIEKVKFDLSDYLLELNKQNGVTSLKWIITLEYKDIGKVDEIIIPKEVKEKAIKSNEGAQIDVNIN